ncbi:MAG TPA: DUF1549 domain-containing protein [Bryobacteraceae bacterium]|jgi:hypothetical protein
MKVLLFALAMASRCLAQDPTQQVDDMERAHRSLIQPPVSKSAVAGSLTAELSSSLPAQGSVVHTVPIRNYIDQFIFARMQRDKVPHAPLASDGEFARRAYLDATGRIPTTDELQSFLANAAPDKRDRLIDQLTSSSAFVDKWTFYFEDLFRAGGRMGYGLNLFHFWLREWLTTDRPYKDVVTDLLTQGGKSSFSVPGGMYYARDFVKAKDDPTAPDAHDLVDQNDTIDEFTITYSKVFLGLNMACISCHDGAHHLEKVNLFLAARKREDFFGQAAFFGRTRQIMNWEFGYQANTEYTVDDKGPGYDSKAISIVRVPRRGGDATPRFILTGEKPAPGQTYRDELARMITGNIQFSRVLANRIWAEMMGFGIVEPVDEFDLARYDPKNPPPAPWTIQPSNPELLDAMAKDFAANNYSFRTLVRTIMKSSAYQLSSDFPGEWKPDYTSYYARKYVRMLSAAELHDAIVLATKGPQDPARPARPDDMVIQMPEPGKAGSEVKGFLRVFGQSNRDDMPKKVPQSALQAMLLMQSKLVTERVASKSGTRVEELLRDYPDDRMLVERLYLATVSRKPGDAEMSTALQALTPDRKRGAEDLQWALINSPEFIFNY